MKPLPALALLVTLLAGSLAHAAVIAQTQGDAVYESVHKGFISESLSNQLANYVDPTTGIATPITAPGGGQLIVGDVTQGENPAASHQLQIQRFVVSGQDTQFKLTYLGLGLAIFRSVFGVYSYALNEDPATATITRLPLFTQQVTAAGTQATFTVPADHAFGFYVDVDALNKLRGQYYTENFRNSDSVGRTTDHFLTFNTNRGLLLAIEDLAYSTATVLLGDQDYDDLLVGFLTLADGTPIDPPDNPIPEPASMSLLLCGATLLLRRPRRLH